MPLSNWQIQTWGGEQEQTREQQEKETSDIQMNREQRLTVASFGLKLKGKCWRLTAARLSVSVRPISENVLNSIYQERQRRFGISTSPEGVSVFY